MSEMQILQYALGMGQAQRQSGMRLGRVLGSRLLLSMLRVLLKISQPREKQDLTRILRISL